ncbi:class I SAM-dependent methyltransferase [Patescibacteria group bacterium]|nr:class I SAM-dependent methyltransferase [Patescibacteria group bacterium]
MNENLAKEILDKVKRDYDLTVDDYTRSRSFIPEDIASLADYAVAGDRILDSGCASGRLYKTFSRKEIDYFGVDLSEKMIGRAMADHPTGCFQMADSRFLSFPENYFDKIYSISVIHNIPSEEFRQQYLKELKRVLKPGGLLILRVWDFWKRRAMPQLFLDSLARKMPGRDKIDFFDVFVPWKNSAGQIVTERYFHCFTKRELEKIIRVAGFDIEKVWRDGQDPRTNIYLIARKP